MENKFNLPQPKQALKIRHLAFIASAFFVPVRFLGLGTASFMTACLTAKPILGRRL
ncbi:hypothetical protein YA0871_07465 [Pseudomonas paralactis]|uniref:Uncharacterized protein n=1 Tax=Pseudomonas paralactis TaxID=1615673 RepID=A0ABS0UWS4_9PSED|nr:hypothetical protein [Pseudomonas paralactis]MBI6632493.1 hypothetical protein [Pseudomonas paralactis]